jgi:hypothetical protein
MNKGGKGKNLPDEDEVIRYVPWTRLRKDEDENVLAPISHTGLVFGRR